ncbi:MAG: helix-turn-helix domain-containing protein [Candidatus Methanomethylophilaceae archaeon]|nr:helix-turn-helix domain-containing protein [Candidatus Methanomethylophilaceae archaeon]
MKEMDIDMILSMVSNPTRRRILEALVREPCYPLQLSREIGVSQQAIMKNLDLLEKNGMVVSHQVTSTMGPMRAMYAPTSEFTLVIDMRNRMFVTNIIEEDEAGVQEEIPKTENLDSARQEIAQIDREIEALERERSALVRKREQLIYSAMSKLGDDMTYGHRDLTYQLLNRPSEPTEDVIQDMDGGRGNIKKKLAEIDNAMRQ